MYKKKFQSMVTGPIGCVGLHVLVPVEAEWKHVHVCVRIRRHRRVEKIVWEVHMKCSSALRLYVLVSITCTSFKYYFFLTFWSLVIFYKNKTWLAIVYNDRSWWKLGRLVIMVPVLGVMWGWKRGQIT